MSNRYSFSRTTWLRYSWLLLVAFLFSINVSAQVSAYSFTEGVSTYTPLSGGINASSATGDDGIQPLTNIGFTFNLGGVSYTQFSVNTNGLVRLGTVVGGSGWTNSLGNTAVQRPLIAALWDDGHRNTGSISYLTTGSAPNRVLEINFNGVNIGGGGATSATNTVSYSIRLFETTNVIQFNYGGTLATAGALTASIGINDMTSFLSVTPLAVSTTSSVTANNAISSLTNLVNKRFTFSPPPPCTTVTAGGTATTTAATPCSGQSFTLSVTGATTNVAPGVTFQWYSSPDDVSYSPITGATSASLSTATTVTTYYRRATICAAGPSELNSTSVLVTPSAANAAPYNENFNSLASVGTTIFPTCWFEQNGDWSSSDAASFAAHDPRGGTGNYVTNLGTATNEFLWTSAVSLAAGTTYEFSTWMVTDGLAGWSNVGLFVNNLPNSTGSTQLGTLVSGPTNTSYSQVVRSFTPTISGVYFFGVRVNATATPGSIGFDDFSVTAPTCLPPASATGTLVSITSASFTWPAATLPNIGYEWELRTSGDAGSGPAGLITQGSGNVTTQTFTGLTSDLNYTLHVRTNCDAGGFSSWVASAPLFVGYCTPTYTFGKTSGDLISNIAIVGTTLANSTGTAQTNPAYTFFNTLPNHTGELAAGGSYTVSISVGTWGGQVVKAWIDYDDDGVFEASEVIGSTVVAPGLGNAGPFPAATFPISLSCSPPLGVHRLRVRSAWQSGVPLLPTPASLDACVNYGYGETEDYLVNVTTAVPCPAPSSFANSAVTPTSASFTWNIGCVETEWQVQYGTVGFNPALNAGTTVISTTNTGYTVSGLTPLTNYEFYVRADCDANGNSTWVGPVAVQTQPICAITTFPSVESFDGATDICWTVVNANADGDTWTLNGFNPRTGAQSASINTDFNAGANDDYLISPAVTLTGNERLNFWYRVNSAFEPNDFEVLLSTTGTSPSSFTTVLSPLTSHDNLVYENQIIDLSSFTGTVHIAFRVPPAGLDGWVLYLDDITFETIPTCDQPIVTAVNPVFNGVSFNVAPGTIGTPSNYEYEIVLDNATPTGVGVSTPGGLVSATGLTANTAYDLYVRTNCGGVDGFSLWSGPISFTTPPPPPANDQCADAITISCASSPVVGTTVNSTVDANYVAAGPNLGDNTTERGVWYRIVGDDQEYTITTCQTPANFFDSRLTVFEGTCSGLVPLVGNDDFSGCSSYTLSSRVVFSAFAGTDYYVFVHGYQSGTALSATGAFQLTLTCAPACIPQAYNQCANAAVLTPNITCVNQNFTTQCATPTVGLANPAGVSIFATYTDSWFALTPTTADLLLTFTYGTASGLRYTLYSGTCGALTQLAPNNLIVSGTEYGIFGANIGQTYYVRVGNAGAGVDGTFDVCVRSLPCATPTTASVALTNPTTMSVTHNGVAGDSYIIEYGPAGFVPGTAGVAGTNGTIVSTTTLTTAVTIPLDVTLDVYVRKNCSASAEGYSFNIDAGTVDNFIVVPTSGTATVTACGRNIYDSGRNGNYLNNSSGTLVVNPSSGTVLALSGSFNTEEFVDFITIYEGSGTGGAILFDGSGSGSINVQATAPDVPLTISFTSDFLDVASGFVLNAQCLSACGGVTEPGVVLGPSSACSGQLFTLTAGTQELGRSYLWQRRTAGTSWVNIPGETNPTLTISQTVATDYRVRVGCDFDNTTATSPTAAFSVALSPFAQCYCTPTTGTNSTVDMLASFNLGAISNNSGVNPSVYTSYPASSFTTTLTRGGEFTGTFSVGTFGTNNVGIWIDLNRDGSFQSTERLYVNATNIPASSTTTFTITIPNSAQLGTTALRVRRNDVSGGAGVIDPCLPYSFQETEDYVVTIANGSPNDARANAQSVTPAVFPGCSNISGNLANATPSQGTPGNDLWYSFTASSNAVRIQLTGAQDCELELENAGGTTITSENATTSNGNEILAFGGLTPGTQYWLAVRSLNASPSSFSCCIQSLNDSRCDSGPIFSSLCNTFKVDWTGTSSYVARFTETAAPFAVHTASITGSTSIPLRNIAGLQHNRSYTVSVDAIYTVVDAGGNTSTITATSNESCPITITQHPLVNLRGIDRDPATRTIGAFISTDVNVCGVSNWQWSFELVDNAGNPVGLEGPQEVLANSTSRFIRTSSIPGVAAGNRYRVRVRPVFPSGSGIYDDASFHYVRIASSAGMAEVFDNTANPEEVYFERNTENGVFAALYPNPNNGDMVNLNLAGIDSDNVNVRIMDASGRIVWTNRYVVEGALNTIIAFDRPLTSGIYLVEMTFDNQVITERMMVTK